MNLDPRIREYAPFAIPVVILVAGWLLLVRPTAADTARAGRELEALRARERGVRAMLAEPPAPAVVGDAAAAFVRQVAAGDATAALLEQLARLASRVPVGNLLIETGPRVALTGADAGPQVTGGPGTDPRFALFETPLAYSPIEMSFDADYAALGEFLWNVRDLATTVEIRRVSVKPLPRVAGAPADGRVHVAVTLFAYARAAAAPGVVQTSGPGASR